MKPQTGWIISVCFFVALIGGFFILKSSSSGAPLDMSFATTTAPVVASSTAAAKSSQNVPAGYMEYLSKDYGFSVSYPGDSPPQEFLDPGGKFTVLFQGAVGEPGFQIAVAPIEGTTITPERFNMDEPSGVKLEQRDTVIDGVPAITFFGFDAGVGRTREIWFIHNHFLYEVLTYKELDSELSEIMKTWRFI
jgi:hypothetical protein